MGTARGPKRGLGEWLVIFTVLTFLLAIFSLASVLLTEIAVQPYRTRGVPARGTITRVERLGSRTGFRRVQVIYWNGLSGEESRVIEATVNAEGWMPGWQLVQEGEEIEILYLPEDPEHQLLPRVGLDRASYRFLSRYEFTFAMLLGGASLLWLIKRLTPEILTPTKARGSELS